MSAPARSRETHRVRRWLRALGGVAAGITLAALCMLAVVMLLNAGRGPDAGISAHSGLLAAVAGTLWLAILTAAIAVPVGVGAAVYLEEYAPRTRAWRFLASVLANLAGVPPVVYGIAGLALFVRGMGLGPSILAGGLTLGVLTVPRVIANSRRALASVPESLRWNALALGATRWQVVREQVLRAAAAGIVKGCSAALVRAVGAAAPLLIIGAASFTTFAPVSPSDPLTSLPTQIFAWTARPQAGFPALAAGASVTLLFVMALIGLVLWDIRRRHGEARR